MVTTPSVLRVVFFGTPDFAVPTLHALLTSRHSVVAVVTQPDRPRGRGHKTLPSPVKEVAMSHGVSVYQPERLRDESFLQNLKDIAPDLGVVAAYGKILTDVVLAIPRIGLINVHASLLPKYRGAAPIHRAVLAGEAETGITIMRVVKALDAGPMLARVTRPINSTETSLDVERDLASLGATALVNVVDALSAGPVEEVPQADAEATYAPKLQKADGHVRWQASATEIHNQIRGLHPWPHAFAELRGHRCLLLRSEIAESVTGSRADSPAGTVLDAHGDMLRVQTGTGSVRILELQVEGRRPLTAREFLAGHALAPGDMFTESPIA